MHAFQVHPQKTPPPATKPPRQRRWRRWGALTLLVLGVGGLVWAVRPDPHLARAKTLQKELFSAAGKSLSPEERKARFAEYREQVKHLTSDQKWELAAPMRERQKAEMDRYFALAPAEKIRYLDEHINRSEKMRKEWQQKGAAARGAGAKGGSPGGAAGGPFGGGFAAGAGKSGGPGQRAAPSAEEREKRRKEHLDRTTPEERAQRDRFRKDMADRRKQRGLPPRG